MHKIFYWRNPGRLIHQKMRSLNDAFVFTKRQHLSSHTVAGARVKWLMSRIEIWRWISGITSINNSNVNLVSEARIELIFRIYQYYRGQNPKNTKTWLVRSVRRGDYVSAWRWFDIRYIRNCDIRYIRLILYEICRFIIPHLPQNLRTTDFI